MDPSQADQKSKFFTQNIIFSDISVDFKEKHPLEFSQSGCQSLFINILLWWILVEF